MNITQHANNWDLSVPSRRSKLTGWSAAGEDMLAGAALLAMALLPVLELICRNIFKTGITGAPAYVQNLALWVGFLGAILAARSKQHLTFVPSLTFFPVRWQRLATLLASAISALVALGLCWAAWQFVRAEFDAPTRLAGWLPIWMVQAVLPLSFMAIAFHFVCQSDSQKQRGIALVTVLVLAGCFYLANPVALFRPGLFILLIAGVFGAPIFVVLAGAALLLFTAAETPIASLPVETYRLVVSPSIPTIPLFTLAGLILAEGGASTRLLRLFRAWFGWLPGGLPIVTTLLCAFFTTCTGASGVTILALGGLLLPVLRQSGYREGFSIGLLTATGSIGILFPPSLPVILYGVSAHVPIPELFKAGFIPGLLLVAAVCIMGVRESARTHIARPTFDGREALAALWQSKWELLMPVITLAAIFGGFCTLSEAAAITAVYAILIESLIYRDLNLRHDLPRVLVTCATMMGGVFVILGAAMGLTNYLVDAQIPALATAWVQAHIHSKLMFLLVLNLFLFAVGCLMDIYSAIIIQAPLLIPVSQAFGIDPLHLGIIFLANLELGYLTPPVGLNIFLASYRFNQPVLQVFRDTLPFLIALTLVVLLITYVPALTTGMAEMLK